MKTTRNLIQMWLLCAAMLPATLQAQFKFITNNNAITITGYTGSGGNVTIPSTTNGYPVTTIGTNAFYYKTALTGVVIPDSVTSIRSNAFFFCSGLTNVTIGSGVTSIGDYAFYYCYGLRSVTIPNSVTNIGNSAFYYCSGLTNVTIGSSVTSIGDYAFSGCSRLTSVTIPNSVTSIGNYAFESCSGLTNVTIGSGSIGNYAFEYCSGLTKITIGSGVISIGSEAFYGCFQLTCVTIPDSVTSIGDLVFDRCFGLANIAVNAANPSYASAGGVLFNQTLTTLIEFPGGSSGSYSIPNSVTCIGNHAFYECSHLTSVTVPNSVTSIGYAAFGGSGLTNLTIGSNVSSIGSEAFEYCNLHRAYFQGNAPSVDGGAGSADSTVFLDESGTVYYVPGTTGWSSTFGGWPTALWYQPKPMILGNGYGLGASTNGFGFTISWATNISVVVEACTDLASSNWCPVTTNALTSGTNYFNDSDWTNYPSRFYRIRSP